MFGRNAFLADQAGGRTRHQCALADSKHYEERVTDNISNLVFGTVFPDLAAAIAVAAPPVTPLEEVHDAALVLLYRLLFLLYAEDRALLPVGDRRYDNISIRQQLRHTIGLRMDQGDAFSDVLTGYYGALNDLCNVINQGDHNLGLPPYNGGLFNNARAPLLAQIQLSNQIMAGVVDALSFEQRDGERHYINYRSLSVQQLGSIYERLLEFETVREGDAIVVRPNVYARKVTGSYYTPEPLVALILKKAVEPLVEAMFDAFRARVEDIPDPGDHEEAIVAQDVLDELVQIDPAEALLELKICDPAMGSGHFLVSLVDLLTDRVILALGEAHRVQGYVSPLVGRINDIRDTILGNAAQHQWAVRDEQLEDRQIVRRMVLKRCIYGVDKNPMAVELAKVSLWLHTFTVGAPLSFLDHHLRCGNSLFGSWVHAGLQPVENDLFLREPLQQALAAAAPMQAIEALSDAEIEEAAQSAELFDEIQNCTAPLDAFLTLLHAFDWLKPERNQMAAIGIWLTGNYGDPIEIALGNIEPGPDAQVFADLLADANSLIGQERFLNWQVAFPGVWTDWENADRPGGFDAVIGNPPWERIKLKQVEWFAVRRQEIALAQRANERRQMISALEEARDPLAAEYQHASQRARTTTRMAHQCGDYPYLARGDINLYSLFVEHAFSLVQADGIVGLLVPSGIASDSTAAPFFLSIATEGRLRVLYDFENRRTRFEAQPFFPDVDSRFKFCVFVAGRSPSRNPANCAFFLQDVSELNNNDRCYEMTAAEFTLVNPNTRTAPIFQSHADADLNLAIYRRHPVLVKKARGEEEEEKAWPVNFQTSMFHMTNAAHLFRSRQELEEQEHAWGVVGTNRFDSQNGQWLPLYEGKMVQAFDHRAASIIINPGNLHRPGQPVPANVEQHADPEWLPTPRFWVPEQVCQDRQLRPWSIAFKNVTATTNNRTMIASFIPECGAGHSLCRLIAEDDADVTPVQMAALGANLNATIYDYLSRQKVQGQNMSKYIVEQIPVIPPIDYEETLFGQKTAAEIIREAVLELSYTSHDMAAFARDLGHVNAAGEILPPFQWNEDRRLRLRAKLDAVFFLLYDIRNRDDIRYIYSTFPAVEHEERERDRHDRYLTRDLCLAWLNPLNAGQPDANVAA